MCGQFVHIRIFIQVKNNRNIKNVGRSTDLIAFFLQGREFILVINFMNVRSEDTDVFFPLFPLTFNKKKTNKTQVPLKSSLIGRNKNFMWPIKVMKYWYFKDCTYWDTRSYVPFPFVTWGYFIIMFLEAYKGKLVFNFWEFVSVKRERWFGRKGG